MHQPAGGVRVEEPAIDLPVALAIASSLRDRPIPEDAIAFGEIGLAGEVRGVARAQARLAEAATMGFRRAIVPLSVQASLSSPQLSVVGVRSVEEAMAAVF